MLLKEEFYLQSDVVAVARELLGKLLITQLKDGKAAGIITETEAYAGITDRASHAWANRRTARTQTMYLSGGVAYVYLCYGIHHLFNVVTNRQDIPHAILIRAVEPVDGLDLMLSRRKKTRVDYRLTSGPGAMSQALGITTTLNAKSLLGPEVMIQDIGNPIPEIAFGKRIGVDYAGEDANLPYRFWIKNSPWVSRP